MKDYQQRSKEGNQIKKYYIPLWTNIFKKEREQIDVDMLNILKRIPIFSTLSKKELKKISLIIYERTYEASEYLFKEDNPGSAMFIIKSGNISVERSANSAERRAELGKKNEDKEKYCYATLTSGDFLGELALLEDTQRSANARCVTKSIALIIFKHDLFDLISREPTLGTKVLTELATMIGKRLKETNDELLSYKIKNEELLKYRQNEGKNA